MSCQVNHKILLKAEVGNPWPEESGWPCGEAAQWWIKEKVSAAWENDKPETYRQDSQRYIRQVQRAQIFFFSLDDDFPWAVK